MTVYFTREHEWIRVEGDTATVGISDHAQEALGDIVFAEVPEAGRLAGVALDVYTQEPLAKQGHPLSALYAMDNVILSPHLTFYTHEAMARLEADTLERCREVLDGRPVTVRSRDPRLRSQARGVRFDG